MIEVSGEAGTAEHDASLAIKDALAKTWPGLEASPASDDHVRIVSGVKLSGHRVSDVDIVVAGLFRTKRYIIPKSQARDTEGNSLVGKQVRVRSFVAAIEVKGQSEKGLEISAGGVKARYGGYWKDATSQNDAQRYALAQYFQEMTGTDPWVYRCVMLTGIAELPKDRGRVQPAAGAIAAQFDATSLLVAMAAVNGIRKHGPEVSVSSGDQGALERILDDPLFKAIVPSSLDRRRMDRIAARPAEAKELAGLLGEQRVHLRGHGGTGKTILLLQSAYEAYLQQGKRCLVLTYNTALAADIQRTLALMSIPSDGEGGGIAVRTAMSFVYSWLDKLELAGGDGGFEDYVPRCAEALDYFERGALGDAEIDRVRLENPDQFGFDAILIDEAQDWPQEEADLLIRLYGGKAISLADGIAQLVRGSPTNWRAVAPNTPKTAVRHLDEGLRMKANLCVFANSFAEETGLPWHVERNSRAAGGRILIAKGRYDRMPDLQVSMLEDALRAGNMPIDLLHCVPPSGVVEGGGKRHSLLGESFGEKSWEVWDGVDENVRRNFPRSTGALRVLQYESCRGLEGWSAVLDGFDEFWELKRQQAFNQLGQSSAGPLDPVAHSVGAAWRWCMIPITRAIDTLAITLRDPSGELGTALTRVAKALPDIVEIVE